MGEPILQIVFLYILYVAAISFIFLKGRKFLKINRLFIVILLLCPLLLYLPTEIKTLKHRKEFNNIKFETGFNLPIVYYRVFSISETSAKLYIVEGEAGKHQIGNYYWFTKVNGQWEFNGRWETVWTNVGGSASGFTFPPYF